MWTTQNIYDYVVNHLRTGNVTNGHFRSINDKGPCFCAKGCLMDNTQQQKLLFAPNELGIHNGRREIEASLGQELTTEQWEMLHDLEWILERVIRADMYRPYCSRFYIKERNEALQKADKETCYQEIAKRYNLTYKPVGYRLENLKPVDFKLKENKKSKTKEGIING